MSSNESDYFQSKITKLTSEVFALRTEILVCQKNYSDLYNFNTSIYITIDSHYTIKNLNFKASQLLGIDRNQLFEHFFLNFVTHNSQSAFTKSIAMLYTTQSKQICQLKIIQKGGKKRSIILESSLLNGELVQLCLLDETDNHNNLHKIEHLEDSLTISNHLLHYSNEALAACNNEFYVTVLNQAFQELFSNIFATKIGIGMSLVMALADFPDLKAKIMTASEEALLGKKSCFIVENHRNKHEIYYCYEISIQALFNRLRQKNELMLRIKNLGDQAIQEKEQCRQRVTIAQTSAAIAISEVASALAHDVSQPLSAIVAYSRSCLFLIKNTVAYPGTGTSLLLPIEQIALQAEHARAIIHNIRNLVCAGDFECEETDMNQLIRATIAILDYELLDSALKIMLRLKDDLPRVMVNKTHIMQVILNLVRNSIEALQNNFAHKPELWIETKQVNDEVEIHIRDNGPGIPLAHKHKILHTYFTTKPQGSGLGLRICRTLVEKHSGKLILQEHQENGAWFMFTLPIPALAENIYV